MKFIRNTIIILVLLAGLAWFAVSPASQIGTGNQVAQANSQDLQTALSQVATNMTISDQEVTSKVELDQAAFNGLLKGAFEGNQELSSGSYELTNGKVVAKIPYRLFGVIQSQIELDVKVAVEEQNLVLEVASARLGRLPIPGAMIEQILKDQSQQYTTVIVTGKKISLPLSQQSSAINAIEVQSGKMVLRLKIDQTDLLQYGLAALESQAS